MYCPPVLSPSAWPSDSPRQRLAEDSYSHERGEYIDCTLSSTLIQKVCKFASDLVLLFYCYVNPVLPYIYVMVADRAGLLPSGFNMARFPQDHRKAIAEGGQCL